MRTKINHTIVWALLGLLAAALTTGCLFHTKEDSEDGGVLGGGTLRLEGFPIGAEGIDPAATEDDGGPTSNVGEWCQLFIDCVCEMMSSDYYDECVEYAESATESICQQVIEDDYSMCIED